MNIPERNIYVTQQPLNWRHFTNVRYSYEWHQYNNTTIVIFETISRPFYGCADGIIRMQELQRTTTKHNITTGDIVG